MKQITFITRSLLIVAFSFFITNDCISQKSREEIPDKYKWNLTDIYKTDDEWRAAKDAISLKLKDFDQFKGTLTRSSGDLLKAMNYSSELRKEAVKLFIYAGMNSDLDTRDMKYASMSKELQQMFAEFGARSAFFQPEILTAEWSLIEGYIKSEPGLQQYRMGLENMFRTKKHTLGEPEERIMALSGLTGGVASSVYNTFSNAEMPFPEVTLSDGSKTVITQAEYSRLRTIPDRNDRKKVFETFWNSYKKFKASYGEMLYGSVKTDVFQSKARNYGSSLEAALYPNNIPAEVYHSLIENVNRSLPAFHRYLQIKKRMMGVDTLRYYDLYAPVVKDVDLKYSFDEGTKVILEALKPLGKEYVETVMKAFNERWIDVYPTKGKQSGAYSNGAFYDGHPYILLNYNDLYDDVGTLAHELGHTMQSYFSNKTQPYPLAGYPIFVAEVASTFNEVLLFNHMLKKVTNDDLKLSLLMSWLDDFKGTLFRQTQFAEFELKIHEAAEKGIPLTGESLSKIYMEIVKAYYGHDKGICYIDDYIEMEWAFIPHFYNDFYVYQYSTAFTASISLAEKVLEGDKDAVNRYIQFLSAGGSDYPINLLKNAGVDLTTSDPFDKTIASMNRIMDDIEKILDKKAK